MNTPIGARETLVAWDSQKARWLVIAVHVVIIGIAPTTASFGVPGVPRSGNPAIAFALGLLVLALQLRHSFAIARGERPRYAWLTFLALVVLVYLPIRWYGWYWVELQVCVIASLPIFLRGWPLIVAMAAPIVGTDVAGIGGLNAFNSTQLGVAIYSVVYYTEVLAFEAAALYGSARLLGLVNELREARAELAETAIGQERLRISRDLHDLLGQSLSAISLKGDLASRLLPMDPGAARTEVLSLTVLARDALKGILAVSRDQHAVSLQTETEGAAALLSAAGIEAQIGLDLPELEPPVEGVLAWTVREGVANALRHSQAHRCYITGGRRDGHVFLEIVNDGARAPMDQGSGLAGLTERARALSGSASGRPTGDGQFRLLVEIPMEHP
jgi:two-component system sensor histidine kinase DesK